MENLILNSIQEIFLFDLVEMAILLCFYIMEAKVKIKRYQFVYNLGILTILDFIISALNLPVIMQIIFTFIVAIYLKAFFQITIRKNIIIIIKWFILVSFDMLYAIIFKSLFDIQLISMFNGVLKFYYLIPCKSIEFLIIYLYYNKGGKNFMKKTKKLGWIGSIIKRKLQK